MNSAAKKVWDAAHRDRRNAQARARRVRDPEKRRAWERSYRERYPERVRESQVRWEHANPEKVKARRDRFRAAHGLVASVGVRVVLSPEERAARQRVYRAAWRASHRAELAAYQRAWRAAHRKD